MTENEITEIIIGCAIKVHTSIGPGLLESAYEACLFYELSKTGLLIERQKPLPLVYEEIKLDCGYRSDIISTGLNRPRHKRKRWRDWQTAKWTSSSVRTVWRARTSNLRNWDC
jgi:hypothetical protein